MAGRPQRRARENSGGVTPDLLKGKVKYDSFWAADASIQDAVKKLFRENYAFRMLSVEDASAVSEGLFANFEAFIVVQNMLNKDPDYAAYAKAKYAEMMVYKPRVR